MLTKTLSLTQILVACPQIPPGQHSGQQPLVLSAGSLTAAQPRMQLTVGRKEKLGPLCAAGEMQMTQLLWALKSDRSSETVETYHATHRSHF